MPIKHIGGGGTMITGDSIGFFRLVSLRGAVGLELKGLKMSRGPVVWKRVAKEFGIKGNKQAVYDWLCARVNEMKAVQEHQVEESGRLKREVGGQEVQ
jgi:hypothetical protein